MPSEYVPIDRKRALNETIARARDDLGENLDSGVSWGTKPPCTVWCRCGGVFRSRVHVCLARFQVITQFGCPSCRSRTNSKKTEEALREV